MFGPSYNETYADCSYCEAVLIVDKYATSFCSRCRSTLIKRVA
jgi:uncharacterized paraquat-inducible protein A